MGLVWLQEMVLGEEEIKTDEKVEGKQRRKKIHFLTFLEKSLKLKLAVKLHECL